MFGKCKFSQVKAEKTEELLPRAARLNNLSYAEDDIDQALSPAAAKKSRGGGAGARSARTRATDEVGEPVAGVRAQQPAQF